MRTSVIMSRHISTSRREKAITASPLRRLRTLRTEVDSIDSGALRHANLILNSATLGQSVRAELPGGREVVGQATDIDAGGALVIDSADGVVAVSAGDVVHLRPAAG